MGFSAASQQPGACSAAFEVAAGGDLKVNESLIALGDGLGPFFHSVVSFVLRVPF